MFWADLIVCQDPDFVSALGLVPVAVLVLQDPALWVQPPPPVPVLQLQPGMLLGALTGAAPWPRGEGRAVSRFLDGSRPLPKALWLSVVWELFLFEDCHVD